MRRLLIIAIIPFLFSCKTVLTSGGIAGEIPITTENIPHLKNIKPGEKFKPTKKQFTLFNKYIKPMLTAYYNRDYILTWYYAEHYLSRPPHNYLDLDQFHDQQIKRDKRAHLTALHLISIDLHRVDHISQVPKIHKNIPGLPVKPFSYYLLSAKYRQTDYLGINCIWIDKYMFIQYDDEAGFDNFMPAGKMLLNPDCRRKKPLMEY